jgi:hypothetical protein
MEHTEFKNSAIATSGNTTFREALPMIIAVSVVFIGVVIAFAKAVGTF